MLKNYTLYSALLLVFSMVTKLEAIDVTINNSSSRTISCSFTGPFPEATESQVTLEPQSTTTQSLNSGAGTYTVSCTDTADDSVAVDGEFDLADSTAQQPSSLIIDNTASGRISLEIE